MFYAYPTMLRMALLFDNDNGLSLTISRRPNKSYNCLCWVIIHTSFQTICFLVEFLYNLNQGNANDCQKDIYWVSIYKNIGNSLLNIWNYILLFSYIKLLFFLKEKKNLTKSLKTCVSKYLKTIIHHLIVMISLYIRLNRF